MDVGKASFQNQCSSTETLWDEKGSLINDPKSPSKKQRYIILRYIGSKVYILLKIKYLICIY